MKNISVIIPSYKPDEKLLSTINGIIEAGFSDIIVVDDGGGEKYSAVFNEVRKIKECTVLVHPVNRGKGAALKTAFAFFKENRKDFIGAVSVDADGQHLAKDIISVCEKLKETNRIVLGCRDFSLPDVPARSRFGNNCTVTVVRLFFGMRVSDTQTGLRAFPMSVISEMIAVDGDRYEYETHMLFHMNRKKLPFEEVKISTVYIDDNSSSHFRPIRDSIRIYSLIIKYLLSSIGSAVIDAAAYFFLKLLLPPITVSFLPSTFPASFIARVISSLFNYFVNAKAVFKDETNGKTLLRYYVLAAVQICISALSVFLLEYVLKIRSASVSTLIKVAVDTVLFFFSFRIQHKWVFGGNE